MGTQLPLSEYVREVWRHRQFAFAVPAGELRAQNMDTLLGNLWHLLNPLLLIATYYFVFGIILDTSRGVDNFIGFLAVGVFMFHYTQKSVTSGARSIVGNESMMRSLHFPRAILPISSVIGQTLAFVPALGVMLTVAIATGESIRLAWLLLLPILTFQAFFNLGATFLAARLTTAFRDVENVLPYVFRLTFYMSGILYPVTTVLDDPLLLKVFNLNPMYAFATIARGLLLQLPAPASVWWSALGWSVALFLLGTIYFRRGEQSYGRG